MNQRSFSEYTLIAANAVNVKRSGLRERAPFSAPTAGQLAGYVTPKAHQEVDSENRLFLFAFLVCHGSGSLTMTNCAPRRRKNLHAVNFTLHRFPRLTSAVNQGPILQPCRAIAGGTTIALRSLRGGNMRFPRCIEVLAPVVAQAPASEVGAELLAKPSSESSGSPAHLSPAHGLAKLVAELLAPYWKGLVVVFTAMLVEASMSLAAPWPLKVIIDDVVGAHHSRTRISWMASFAHHHDKMHLAALAALSSVAISALAALASYIDNYYTESIGQRVANDLRMKLYSHLHRLSLTYYDRHQTSTILSRDILTLPRSSTC
jgi:hypothetical protein